MANLMPLVHQARRTIRNRQEGNPFATDAVIADLSVLPLPDSLKLKGGALAKVMDSLRNKGLIRVLGGDGGPERVVLTSEGMAAIGVEAEGDEAPTVAGTAPT